jgi:predicted secreted protein
MMTFAAPSKSLMGELIVSGGAEVTINGETANTGRTVFSSNTITTPANASATINLGKLGQIDLAPNSSINLTFSENAISGTLLNGRVKVSGANEIAANIQTKTASVVAEPNQAKVFTVSFDANKTNVVSEVGTVTLNESGKAIKVGQTTDTDDDDFFGVGNGLLYAIIFGGAAAAIIWVAVSDSNEVNLSGGSTVVSPTR